VWKGKGEVEETRSKKMHKPTGKRYIIKKKIIKKKEENLE